MKRTSSRNLHQNHGFKIHSLNIFLSNFDMKIFANADANLVPMAVPSLSIGVSIKFKIIIFQNIPGQANQILFI